MPNIVSFKAKVSTVIDSVATYDIGFHNRDTTKNLDMLTL